MVRSTSLVACLLTLFALTAPPRAAAKTFEVDSSFDDVDAEPGDGVCSRSLSSANCTLRAAVMEANALPGKDEIVVPAGIYRLTESGANEDQSRSGDLDVLEDLVIRGEGSEQTIIDAVHLSDRVLEIPSAGSLGRLEISGITIQNGRPPVDEFCDLLGDHLGGGIAIRRGAVELSEVAIRSNRSGGAGGGGVFNEGGPLSVLNSVISGNYAAECYAWGGGGVLDVSDHVLTIRGSIFVANGVDSSGGAVRADRVDVRDSKFIDNSADEYGGAIRAASARIVRSTFRGNAGTDSGGAVCVDDATIEDSFFEANVSAGAGNAIDVIDGSIVGSTLLDNFGAVAGGGLSTYGSVEVRNTTISGSTALSGGAIAAYGGDLLLSNVTLVDNFADWSGGGLLLEAGATATLKNSIVADNRLDFFGFAGPDCYVDESGGRLVSAGHNLIGDATDCALVRDDTDQLGTASDPIDPRLAPIADNGGPTPTHDLLPDSPALDLGSPESQGAGTCEARDQRGVARPVDGDFDRVARCDIGAVEADPEPSTNPPPLAEEWDDFSFFDRGRLADDPGWSRQYGSAIQIDPTAQVLSRDCSVSKGVEMVRRRGSPVPGDRAYQIYQIVRTPMGQDPDFNAGFRVDPNQFSYYDVSANSGTTDIFWGKRAVADGSFVDTYAGGFQNLYPSVGDYLGWLHVNSDVSVWRFDSYPGAPSDWPEAEACPTDFVNSRGEKVKCLGGIEFPSNALGSGSLTHAGDLGIGLACRFQGAGRTEVDNWAAQTVRGAVTTVTTTTSTTSTTIATTTTSTAPATTTTSTTVPDTVPTTSTTIAPSTTVPDTVPTTSTTIAPSITTTTTTTSTTTTTIVPEPTSGSLRVVVLGLLGAVAHRRRQVGRRT